MPSAPTIPIVLNGAPAEAPADATLLVLLESMDVRGPGIAVAVNDRVVRRDDHGNTLLHSGDRIEIIQAVGGG